MTKDRDFVTRIRRRGYTSNPSLLRSSSLPLRYACGPLPFKWPWAATGLRLQPLLRQMQSLTNRLIFNVLHIANHGWRILINSPSMHYKSAIALADLSSNSLRGRGRRLADLSTGPLFGHGPGALKASCEHGKAVLHEAGCKAGWI